MIFSSELPFIKNFLNQFAQGLKASSPNYTLSITQRYWLGFCLMGILLSNKVCWSEFERVGLGGYTRAALSWMFRHSPLPWEAMLHTAITLILLRYGITEGELSGDDTDRRRAKVTKRIYGAHKLYDKKTSGFFNGQALVFLVLVTPKITLPVGFRFYRPDPVIKAWKKRDKALKKAGLKTSERPPKPAYNPAYPNKLALMVALLEEFKTKHPTISVKALLVDALYGNAWFMSHADKVFPKTQIVSQLNGSQKTYFRNREITLEEYFKRYPGVAIPLPIRGGITKKVVLGSARLYIKAHHQKRFIVALKYENESAYRYLVATDMSWRAQDIATAYTLRWLAEVFFEDWKLHEGWGQSASQYDYEGSSRSLILSLLLDYALLLHPEQLARIENKLPAYTVGSLQQRSRMEALITVIRGMIVADDPHEELAKLLEVSKRLFPLRDSSKHMIGRDLGRLEPSPSLIYRAAACMA